jgi:hypothetical protein
MSLCIYVVQKKPEEAIGRTHFNINLQQQEFEKAVDKVI